MIALNLPPSSILWRGREPAPGGQIGGKSIGRKLCIGFGVLLREYKLYKQNSWYVMTHLHNDVIASLSIKRNNLVFSIKKQCKLFILSRAEVGSTDMEEAPKLKTEGSHSHRNTIVRVQMYQKMEGIR